MKLGYSHAYTQFLTDTALTDGSVLDIGTGTGTFALSWVEAGGSTDLTLLDPSMPMLEQAAAQFAQNGVFPQIVNTEFEVFQSDTTFDAILASHVFEHFADPADAMRQFAKRLSSGGRLYLTISKPHWCNWLIWLRFRHRWYGPEAVCEMARAAGLSQKCVHTFRAGPPSRTSLGYVFSKPQPN